MKNLFSCDMVTLIYPLHIIFSKKMEPTKKDINNQS